MTFKYNPNIYIADLNEIAVDDAIQHAYDEYPLESCGAIVDEEYIRFKNESETPEKSFEIKDPLWFDLYVDNKIECLVHSHNNFKSSSIVDQIQQKELDIKSLIINLKHRSLNDCIVFGCKEFAPLEGRPFFFGVFDCVTLVVDYITINNNIQLPEPLREWDFWNTDEDKFIQELITNKDVPLMEVELNDIKKNDILMYNIGSNYINHVAVVCNDNWEVLHHMYNNVSGRYPINFNRKNLRKVMRLIK